MPNTHYPKVLVVALAAALVCIAWISRGAYGQQQTSPQELADLKHKSAWLMIGLIDEAGDWVLKPPIFEFVSGPRDGKVPQEGARIKLLSDQDLVILGYGQNEDKEGKFHESPTSRETPLAKTDYLPFAIKKGTEVNVKVVKRGKPGPKGKQLVWALVTADAPR